MSRTVLVIGANGALGAPIVRLCRQQGDNVAATVSRPHKLDAFKEVFPACDPVIALDLSDADGVKRSLAALISALPRLDAIIACPALAPTRPLEFTPLDTFRETLEVNSVTALAIYQASIDALRQSKGRLIFTSSLSGIVPTPMQGAYCASKFALEALADTMRQECADWGVEIVLLEPGGFRTPTVYAVAEALEHGAEKSPEKERSLYGTLYRQMHHRMIAALDDPDLMSPDAVAQVAIEALNAGKPKTRYSIGPEAGLLIDAKRAKSDRDMDEMILGIYRSV